MSQETNNKEVVAVVAGEEITQEEFNLFLQAVPREQQAYLANPQFRQQCLDQFIALRLYAKLGEELKLEETEEFQTMIANAKRDILAQIAMRETLKAASVSEEEAAAYYEENKEQRFLLRSRKMRNHSRTLRKNFPLAHPVLRAEILAHLEEDRW